MRTDYCGELRAGDVGRRVDLCGWVAGRREHGEHLAFIDLRDHTGIIQCVVDGGHDLRAEYVVRVTGTVRARPDGRANPQLATGEVEIGDCEVTVLNEAAPPPFPITDRIDADETVRLRHRYVDLRRDRLQRNLRLRATVNAALRRAMDSEGFVEVETPMLVASTPEGARDFIVPSRLQPGAFYALPQSPQLFKQLLMVGGVDRYFQIARCLRDEDPRADRQFEFTQLDLEMSFAGQEEVIAAVSAAVSEAADAADASRPVSMGRVTWQEAADRFGTDKPDTRFDLHLVELTDVFAGTEFRAFHAPTVKGIRLPAGGAETSRSRLDALTEAARQLGAKGLVWARVLSDSDVESPMAKFLTETERRAVISRLDAGRGDLVFLVADERPRVNRVLGALRLELARPLVKEGGLELTWVVDFPLFEGLDEDGRPLPAHHPFTMPHPDDIGRLEADPLSVRSQAYDLVLNGWELGSGSVRIHRADVQQRVFDVIGIGPEQARARFGFLLDAFSYGAPPHAGFGMGIDRLVAVLAGEENIREVIAFPKTQSGADPMTGAPTAVDERQLAELGLRLLRR